MKPFDPPAPMAQTINECPQRRTEPCLAHSKGKPDASLTRTNISVWFATPLIEEVAIRVNHGSGCHQQDWLVPLLTLMVPGDYPHSPEDRKSPRLNSNH